MLRLLRNTTLSIWLIGSLAAATISLGLFALSLTAKVATVTASATAAAVAHRKELAATVARVKAKARLRRLIAAIPIVGMGSLIYFEERDYQEWLAENPDGTRERYACELAAITAEVMDEVLQELPARVRPDPDTAKGLLGDDTDCM
jgi:hypothetical protein